MMHAIDRSINRLRLGEFIRARRERLAPTDLGLPSLGRRRTPGLRREEVAQLTGISIAYYTWMEQGRHINISSDVLQALARALHFTDAERTYLFTLAGIDVADHVIVNDQGLHPTLDYIMTSGDGLCAVNYDRWFNLVAATPLAEAVFALPHEADETNLLTATFADPAQRRLWVDWETEARILTGMFRQTLARWPEDEAGEALLQDLREAPDFERLWSDFEVRERPSPHEYFRAEPWHLRHPTVGRLSLHRVAMTVPTCHARDLTLYSPADDVTAARLRSLTKRPVMSSVHRFEDLHGPAKHAVTAGAM